MVPVGVECTPDATDRELEEDNGHAKSANVKHDENGNPIERKEYMGSRVRKYLYSGDNIAIH